MYTLILVFSFYNEIKAVTSQQVPSFPSYEACLEAGRQVRRDVEKDSNCISVDFSCIKVS